MARASAHGAELLGWPLGFRLSPPEAERLCEYADPSEPLGNGEELVIVRAELAEEHNKNLIKEIELRKKIEQKLIFNEKQTSRGCVRTWRDLT